MDKNLTLPEIVLLLNEREKSVTGMAQRDAAFKQEVREFIKTAEPILLKAKANQDMKDKVVVGVITLLLGSLVGLFITLK